MAEHKKDGKVYISAQEYDGCDGCLFINVVLDSNDNECIKAPKCDGIIFIKIEEDEKDVTTH